ncbi:MAG: hypothetical protein AAGD25_02725 [Cyanobacteria bacterium P01_F01_bin.150]
MSYSKFKLEDIEAKLGLTIKESQNIFSQAEAEEISPLLQQILDYNLPLALEIATEKARSEMILTPILIELKKLSNSQISLFSGREFNVDPEKDLVGFCDFLISQSASQLIIKAPVAVVVEAKNDNIQSELGQCIAEMYAAQLFNQKSNNNIPVIYGSVTTGTNWKFMRLVGTSVELDITEYFISNPSQILGILKSFIMV